MMPPCMSVSTGMRARMAEVAVPNSTASRVPRVWGTRYQRVPRVASNPSSFGDRSDDLSTSVTKPASSGQSQQQQQQQKQEADSLLLKALASESDSEGEEGEEGSSRSAGAAGWAATLGVVAGISILMGGGYLFRGQIKHFLDFFIQAVDDWGIWGYLAYAAVYAGLEVLAVPAIPLTMTAGAIFGPVPGTIVVSISATFAATIAFLIARYAARDKIAKLAYKNKRFAAIDRAISRNGLKFVTLLRLSPLLPLAVSNYLYGLTSVDLGSYVLGSWLGMLPGTYAYVTAGHVGKAVLTEGEGSFGVESWQVAVALGATVLALGFVGRLAKNAVEEADREALEEQRQQQAKQAAKQQQAAAAAAADEAPGGAAGSTVSAAVTPGAAEGGSGSSS